MITLEKAPDTKEMPKDPNPHNETFEGKFGYIITVGTRVMYTHKCSLHISTGHVSKITNDYVWVNTGHGDWLRRKVKKNQVPYQLISMEAINENTDKN